MGYHELMVMLYLHIKVVGSDNMYTGDGGQTVIARCANCRRWWVCMVKWVGCKDACVMLGIVVLWGVYSSKCTVVRFMPCGPAIHDKSRRQVMWRGRLVSIQVWYAHTWLATANRISNYWVFCMHACVEGVLMQRASVRVCVLVSNYV